MNATHPAANLTQIMSAMSDQLDMIASTYGDRGAWTKLYWSMINFVPSPTAATRSNGSMVGLGALAGQGGGSHWRAAYTAGVGVGPLVVDPP